MIGATSEETETALDMKHQTVSARYKDLRDWGYIDYLRDEHDIRDVRQTSSGRNAFVHVCTEKGKLAITLGSPISKPGATDPTRRRHRGNPLSAAAFNSLGSQLPTLRLKVLTHIHSMTP
jgi:DNA-binding MarR family transcriptional regulator